jgi:hypothetical protein
MPKQKMIRITPVENYTGMSPAEVTNRATAVYNGLNGNVNFTNLPVALTDFKAGIDSVTALMAEAIDGGRKVTTAKTKALHALIKMMRGLGRYVELNCKDDKTIFESSGFVPAANARTAPAALTEKIRGIGRGAHSGQIVVKLKAVINAGSYELRYGPVVNGALPTAFMTVVVKTTKVPITVQGLTPGTIYAFEARAVLDTGLTDWSDPVTFMCA